MSERQRSNDVSMVQELLCVYPLVSQVSLSRRFIHGHRRCSGEQVQGFADDYAFLIRGLLDLYEADPRHDSGGRWLQWARDLQVCTQRNRGPRKSAVRWLAASPGFEIPCDKAFCVTADSGMMPLPEEQLPSEKKHC